MTEALAYIVVENSLPDHPKMLALATDLLAGFAFFVAATCWADAHGTDGFVPLLALGRIVPGVSQEQAVEMADLLVDKARIPTSDSGLFERVEGGYLIHDYTRYQRTRAEKVALQAKRAAAGSKGGKAKAQGLANPKASATDRTPASATASATSKALAKALAERERSRDLALDMEENVLHPLSGSDCAGAASLTCESIDESAVLKNSLCRHFPGHNPEAISLAIDRHMQQNPPEVVSAAVESTTRYARSDALGYLEKAIQSESERARTA